MLTSVKPDTYKCSENSHFFSLKNNFFILTLAFNARLCYNKYVLTLTERKRSVEMNIGFRENITIEFKSDLKKLSNDVIIESVVAFANTNGGRFFLGVEDNGDITGLHPSHKDPSKLAAFIANKTIPPVAVHTELIDTNNIKYLIITVPKYSAIVAASNGKVLRRRIKLDGEPENIPMYPYEMNSRLSSLRMLDYSAQPVPEAVYSDLDPVEREHLRSIIQNYHGEKTLLDLDDTELDLALRLAIEQNGVFVPTYCGMLLIGRRERLSMLVPTAEATFQELQGTDVVANESFILPMLTAFEKIESYMDARNHTEEMEEGLFRISIPDFDKRAFREALVNAFCHRDYTILGRIRVALDDDGLTISNPGGFIEGVTIENLLTAEPHGRNPALADALKRIGLAERTGRGIDRIFEGSLSYGKSLPDYSESNSNTVNLFIPKSLPDKAFIKMVAEEQSKIGRPLSINALLILNALKSNRRLQLKSLTHMIHINEYKVRTTIEKLVESGLVETDGNGNNRSYILSAELYKNANNVIGYVRQTGINRIRYPELILKFAKNNYGKVTRKDVMQLLHLNQGQAYRLLVKMTEDGMLILVGKGKFAYYKIK